jgi:hypothetical protein
MKIDNASQKFWLGAFSQKCRSLVGRKNDTDDSLFLTKPLLHYLDNKQSTSHTIEQQRT